MTDKIPYVGGIVLYRLTADDAAQVNRRRTTGASIGERMKAFVTTALVNAPAGANPEPVQVHAWPAGAQAHIGNEVREGDVFPMMIVKVWGETSTSAVNGQVFLDGNDVFWATSRAAGDGPGTFSWPA